MSYPVLNKDVTKGARACNSLDLVIQRVLRPRPSSDPMWRDVGGGIAFIRGKSVKAWGSGRLRIAERDARSGVEHNERTNRLNSHSSVRPSLGQVSKGGGGEEEREGGREEGGSIGMGHMSPVSVRPSSKNRKPQWTMTHLPY